MHRQPGNAWSHERSHRREDDDFPRTESPLFGGPADRSRSAYIEHLPVVTNRAVVVIIGNDRGTNAVEGTMTKEAATGDSVSQGLWSETGDTTRTTEQYVLGHVGSPRRSRMSSIENVSEKRAPARQKCQMPANRADSVCLNRDMPDDEHAAVKSGCETDMRTSKTEGQSAKTEAKDRTSKTEDSQGEEQTTTNKEQTEERRRRQSLIGSRDNHRTRVRYRARTFYRTVT